MGQDECEAVRRAFDGIFLTNGPITREFEDKFSKYLSCKSVVGTSNCTIALFMSLKALGIGEGDEVITCPMTFIATPNSALAVGAKPVFVDAEKSTGNIDADLIEDAITPRTKAIIAVHLYGHMCDMKKLREIADRNGLLLIEDAAHCIEGERDGVRPGQLSDAACFSFYATKNMTCGEGGAIATMDDDLAESLFHMRSHGTDRDKVKPFGPRYRHWDMISMGYNGNLSDIQSALLLPQIPKLEKNLARREAVARMYMEAFDSMAGVDYPKTLQGTKHARHLFTIWVDPAAREETIERLQDEGIGIAVNYRPVHLLTYYRERFGFSEGTFPVAERIGASTISLPLYPKLTDHEVASVIEAVRKCTV